MFPDWRKGLSEMARVTRPGGKGVVATWQKRGAGSFMLLGDVLQKLFPDREIAAMPEAITLLSDPGSFARELVNAGFRDPQVEYVTYDFDLNLDALADPDKLGCRQETAGWRHNAVQRELKLPTEGRSKGRCASALNELQSKDLVWELALRILEKQNLSSRMAGAFTALSPCGKKMATNSPLLTESPRQHPAACAPPLSIWSRNKMEEQTRFKTLLPLASFVTAHATRHRNQSPQPIMQRKFASSFGKGNGMAFCSYQFQIRQ